MDTRIINRQEAKTFLLKPKYRQILGGIKIRTTRHNRGPGGAGDLINYGLVSHGKILGVMRIGPAPFGNQPVIAAIGRDLAPYASYIMRLNAIGISKDDLEEFVKVCLARFRGDMQTRGRDLRYLVSLDDPKGWLIDGAHIFESGPCAGHIYQKCGALSAGHSKTRTQPTQWVNGSGELRSIYNQGKNIINDLPSDARLINAGPKQRFVFVLAPRGSVEYSAWRRALPRHVVELEQDQNLNWVQPRLLTRKNSWKLTKSYALTPELISASSYNT